MRSQARWAWVLAVGVAASVAAVPEGTMEPATPVQGAAVVHVHLTNFMFDPAVLSIDAGDTVEWHNHMGSHTATAEDGSWDTGSIPVDDAVSLTYNTGGDFDYKCQFHATFGMTGSLEVVGDGNAAPSVTITNPAEDATVEGTITVEGTAADPEGILSSVEVRIDGGAWSAASGTASWTFSWDTTAQADGTRTVEARSSDGALFSAVDAVSVTVHNGPGQLPEVAFTSPAEGASVRDTVTITGTASDTDGTVTKVEVRMDEGPWMLASGTASWSLVWDTTMDEDGATTLEARATDDSGLTATATRGVTVANPPTVAITSPAAGSVLVGTVMVLGTASDPGPTGMLQQVEVRIDGGAWSLASGTMSWSFTWDTTTVPDGVRTVEARSFDGTLSSSIASRSFTVDNLRPDLAVVEVGATGGGLTYTDLAATVENRGDEASPATVVAFAYQGEGDPQPLGRVSLPALAPGQSAQVGWEWDNLGKLGRFTVYATADPDGRVVEKDEGNNTGEGVVCVPHLLDTGLACLLPPTELL